MAIFQEMMRWLRNHSVGRERDELIFRVGVNTGLRISDIITLKVSHFNKGHITLSEKKTGKARKIKINDALKDGVDSYIKLFRLESDDYLFFSLGKNQSTHIDRHQAWRILTAGAKACTIKDFGTHSMRKTYGYHHYMESNKDIGLVMTQLNHRNPKVTLRYIGCSQDQEDKAHDRVQF